ncbi:unnamed protein product [Notodromas monacha]|uniref:Charged multivesicular body protein 7 n=1 Tax=Notodromas monacha TaxID=399045 RepID=A0A7R9BD83_9CRUS|nr:unnamed protein product [Notodromas monacha]CAG0913168.1 unnamed protein product [Notodromas monacha]
MLKKHPKSIRWSSVFKGIIVIEGLAAAGGYFVWYKLCNSSDFRKYMHQNHAWALDVFYTTLQTFGDESITQAKDLELWKKRNMSAGREDVSKWFPAGDWEDDERMQAMFEPFMSKNAIPEAYEGKMAFWFDVIEKYCVSMKQPLVTAASLRSVFHRKGKHPDCLRDVLAEMCTKREQNSVGFALVPVDKLPGASWASVGESWGGWAFRSASTVAVSAMGWLSPKATDSGMDSAVEFVHPKTIAKMSHELLEDQQALFKEGKCENVMSIECFQRLLGSKYKNLVILEKMLGEMQRSGSVKLGMTSAGKFLKFEAPAGDPITNTDVGVAKLKKLEFELLQRVEQLELDMHAVREEAKKLLGQGQRDMAKKRLRRKRALERKLDVQSGALDNVTDLLDQIRHSRTNAEVLSVLGAGLRSLNSALGHGGPDDALKLMDEVRDGLADAAEVSEAIAAASGPTNIAELEEELAGLLSDEEETPVAATAAASLPELPEVPKHAVTTPQKVSGSGDDLEDRLHEVRDGLADAAEVSEAIAAASGPTNIAELEEELAGLLSDQEETPVAATAAASLPELPEVPKHAVTTPQKVSGSGDDLEDRLRKKRRPWRLLLQLRCLNSLKCLSML